MLFIFLSVSYITLVFIIWFMPKRLNLQEMYICWAVVSLQTLLSDLFIGHLVDYYDLMKRDGPEFSDILIEISLPALFGIIFLNFMPKERKRFILYLVFWVVFSTCYEQLSRYVGYIHYEGWKVWYSVIFYTYANLYMRWHFNFTRKKTIYK